MAVGRQPQISVIGGGACDSTVSELAERVGEGLAKHGAVLVCGGMGGVMEAAARGAARTGGLSVGLLPGYDPSAANPYVRIVLPTGMGHARNVLVVAAADAVIALPGEHGTVSEIALALVLGRPVVAVGWSPAIAEVQVVSSPERAVECALTAAARRLIDR